MYGSIRELEDELPIPGHSELVSGDPLDRLGVAAKRGHLTREVRNLSAQALVAGLDLPQLVLECPVARQALVIEDAEGHRDDREHEQPKGQQPGEQAREATHRRHPLSGGKPAQLFVKTGLFVGSGGLTHQSSPLSVFIGVTTTNPLPDLSYRARKILYAVVTEYIATGEPVGSRRLSRRYGLNLSPASIRNVLADLEDVGYLSQPHTSAGRVPTDSGFRVFVDALVQMRDVTAEDRAAIETRMGDLQPGDDVMRETGRLLSALTGAASLIARPRPDEEAISQIRFVPLGDKRALAVLVTRSGVVQNRVVKLGRDLETSELERLHNYLNELVDGRTLAEVRERLAQEVASQRGHYVTLSEHARHAIDETLASEPSENLVVIEGRDLLFDRPEFADATKIRQFLKTFEEREKLLDLVERTLLSGGVQVLIGSETNLGEIEDISVISASYESATGSAGTLGIIGPARIDYAKVVPVVEFTARMMGRVLTPDSEDEP